MLSQCLIDAITLLMINLDFYHALPQKNSKLNYCWNSSYYKMQR